MLTSIKSCVIKMLWKKGNDMKRVLLIGAVLLYSTAITPVWAVEVSSWADLNTNAGEENIILKQN